MGSNVAKTMNQNISQSLSQNLEAQKQFQLQMVMKQRQLMMATRRAMNREVFKYYSTFMGTMAVILIAYSIKTKSVTRLLAGAPFCVLLAYQYDLSYGKLFSRAKGTAFDIIKDESQMLYPPWNNGIYTLSEYQNTIPYTVITNSFDSSLSRKFDEKI